MKLNKVFNVVNKSSKTFVHQLCEALNDTHSKDMN